MVDKKYDIVVHGATGFTGKLICEYLSLNNDKERIKWSISGRNEEKLSAIAKKYQDFAYCMHLQRNNQYYIFLQ